MRILIGREEIWDGNKNSLSLSKNRLKKLCMSTVPNHRIWLVGCSAPASFESLEINQPRFSQPLDDPIDQVIDLNIACQYGKSANSFYMLWNSLTLRNFTKDGGHYGRLHLGGRLPAILAVISFLSKAVTGINCLFGSAGGHCRQQVHG